MLGCNKPRYCRNIVRVAVLMLATLVAADVFAAEATAQRRPISLVPSTAYTGTVSGDPTAPEGATVELRRVADVDNAFGSSISLLDISGKGGGVYVVSADMSVEGTGQATLWLRAHKDETRLLFAHTARQLVQAHDGWTERQLVVTVPKEATHLVFGMGLSGGGGAHGAALRIRHDAERTAARNTDAKENLDAFIAAVRARALYADRVPWQTFQPRIDAAANAAQSADNYPLYKEILRALGDRHSHMVLPHEAEFAIQRTRAAEAPRVERLGAGVGYVKVPGVRGVESQSSRELSAGIQHQLCAIGQDVNGWVVDLRDNRGGSMWPMLAGLFPLLDDAPPGAFIDREGKVSPWKIRGTRECDLSQAPVAVLMGPRTASSGEMTAIAFIDRPNTRFFGQASAGLATGNSSVFLPDGARIALTTTHAQDRSGRILEQVKPDEAAEGEGALEAAARWLQR
ncbi:S41 family peptidase [Stenotrophomonas sp.]|uniref:S41 family peptidase n=1 Tax=Stenotrophomonas sp. TaxID=69392 RepID=UPI0028974B5A|nr:S41 family peptidase [Stenotrophomonas sp.]